MALSQSALSELLDAIRAGGCEDVLREAMTLVLQELIELEAAQAIGAARYERTDERTTHRNGSRSRLLSTKAGDLELRIPKLRNGSFFPALLEPRRRIDRALWAIVMEAYVHGVSTRKVDDLVAGLAVGDSEDGAFWTAFLRSLRARGLTGVRLVISDAHEGLKAAIGAVLLGAAWQRCRVHFLRNVLTRIPKGSAEMVLAAIRTIFAQPDAASVSDQLDEIVERLQPRLPVVAAMLAQAKADILAFTAFPIGHWKKIWSTNPLERVNKEVKRRTDVVGIFPNELAVTRLAGAVLLEIHDEWAIAERRYLSEGSMARLDPRSDDQATKEVERAKT